MLHAFFQEHKRTFFRFCIIGAFATAINYFAFFLLFKVAGVNFLISSAIGYIIGVFAGFRLNKKYTFQSKYEQYVVEMVKYFMVYSMSLVIGLAILQALAYGGVNILLANIFSIGVTTVTNYAGSKYFVFTMNKMFIKLDYLLYRYHFLLMYIIIGLASLIIEMLIISLMSLATKNIVMVTGVGFLIGMLFSFVINAKLNFKIPKESNLRTFRIFVLISFLAFALNLVLIRFAFSHIIIDKYYVSRFISAACIFLVSYSLHRRFTFRDVKKVGIAIYLVEKEDVDAIKRKVGYYPDWIHLDLVDTTYNEKAQEIDLAKGKAVRALWHDQLIITHIMSTHPSRYIKKAARFSDVIIIHVEIDEDVTCALKKIGDCKAKAGISFRPKTSLSSVEQYLGSVDFVQVLGIDRPGESGQYMTKQTANTVNELALLKKEKRYKYKICLDGGVRLTNIQDINAEYIVSGSTVLDAKDPKNAIYTLKSNSRHYYEKERDMKAAIEKQAKNVLLRHEFILSGTIVGSFTEKDGLSGISDIDIIVIVDKLTGEKFRTIVKDYTDIGTMLKNDYGYDLIVNTTFGPLKFNKEKTVVFHLMIYDVDSHRDHCRKSPFTCYDWQRHKPLAKEAMTRFAEVWTLQPNHFFNARRSVSDYISDLRRGVVSYREYDFTDGMKEIKKEKKMDDRDKFEFAHHIMRFTMTNYLKLITGENTTFPDLAARYFSRMPKNRKAHDKYFRDIARMKKEAGFRQWIGSDEGSIMAFLADFSAQFKKDLDADARHVLFFRHAETGLNREGLFLGRRTDIGITDAAAAGKAFFPSPMKRVYSSPLRRAKETAKLSSTKIIIDENLAEIDYGRLDGKTVTYLNAHGKHMIEAWKRKEDPRFPGGENTHDVEQRLDAFLQRLHKEFIAGTVGVCTHQVVLRCLIGKLCRRPMHDWHLICVPHLEFLEVIITRDGRIFPNFSVEQNEKIFKEMTCFRD